MRRTLIRLTVGAVAGLMAGLMLPAAAQAAAVSATAIPAPTKSGTLAGYQQVGCHSKGFPVYREIQGTIIVPNADYANGTAGVSYDVYNIGGFPSGVTAGVEVYNSNNQAFYRPFGEWGSGGEFLLAPFSAQTGDKLQITIQNKGAAGWLVGIVDSTSRHKWSMVVSDPTASKSPCQAAAYEVSSFPTYDHLTATTFIDFDATRVSWSEQGKSGVSNLVGTPPANATLFRYDLVNNNSTIAFASGPTDSAGDFSIDDTAVFTQDLAGYEDVQSVHQGFPYKGVEATFKVPKITQVSENSSSFAYFMAGIGNAHGFGVMGGVEEVQFLGSVFYTPIAGFGTSIEALNGITVHPGDTITAFVYSNGPQWVIEVVDDTTSLSEGLSQAVQVNQYDVEVGELAAPDLPGSTFFPVPATTAVTFDHATFTNTSDTTYAFGTVLTKEANLRVDLQNASGAQTIAMASPYDSDKDGFTVQDGGVVPPAPKS